MSSRWKLYLALFMLLAAAYAAWAVWAALQKERAKPVGLLGAKKKEPFFASSSPAPVPKKNKGGGADDGAGGAEEEDDDADSVVAVSGPPAILRGGPRRREAFEASADKAGDAEAAYEARMHVMRVFDVTLKRKPTDAELGKYAALPTEDARMRAIVADYDGLSGGKKTGSGTGGAAPLAGAAPTSRGARHASSHPTDAPAVRAAPTGALEEVAGFAPAPTMAPGMFMPPDAPLAGRDELEPLSDALGRAQVCLDRGDVMRRLRAAQQELAQLAHLVRMM